MIKINLLPAKKHTFRWGLIGLLFWLVLFSRILISCGEPEHLSRVQAPPVPTTAPLEKTDPAPVTAKPEEIDFALVKAQIFEPYCAKCHPEKTEEDGGPYWEPTAYASLVQWKAFVPGKPEESDIYKSVNEDKMPKNGPPLSPELKKLLSDWIASGARETVDSK